MQIANEIARVKTLFKLASLREIPNLSKVLTKGSMLDHPYFLTQLNNKGATHFELPPWAKVWVIKY